MKKSIRIIFAMLLPAMLCASSYRHQRAASEISMLEQALVLYKVAHGDYPKEAGLKELIDSEPAYLKKVPTDPWFKPYVYNYPSLIGNENFDLYSFGANGIDDQGEVDDISNWKGLNSEHYPIERTAEDYITFALVLVVCGFLILSIIWLVKHLIILISKKYSRKADNKSINSQP